MSAPAHGDQYDLPLNEVVFDFYDRAESVSRGYASFDYAPHRYNPADLVKSNPGQRRAGRCLAMLVHVPAPRARARHGEKLNEPIPPHMFEVPIQAAIGGKIIARETVRASARTSPPSATVAT